MFFGGEPVELGPYPEIVGFGGGDGFFSGGGLTVDSGALTLGVLVGEGFDFRDEGFGVGLNIFI